jgi:hypothetical protein
MGETDPDTSDFSLAGFGLGSSKCGFLVAPLTGQAVSTNK